MLTPIRVITLACALAAPIIAANVTSKSAVYRNDIAKTTPVVGGKSTNVAPSMTAVTSFHRMTTTVVYGQTTTAVVQGVPPSHPAHEEAITPTSGPVLESSGPFTMSIVNKYGPGLSIGYTSNVAAPTPIGNPKPAALKSSTEILFPSGWSGVMDITPIMDKSASKIEASYLNSKVHIDVSYVDGYTVPITCSCGEEVITGCNVELFNETMACPDEGPGPICYNPSAFLDDGPAHPFFAPCEAASYTYPKDDEATHGCSKSLIECCVGSECPANPNQPGELKKKQLKRAAGRRAARRAQYT